VLSRTANFSSKGKKKFHCQIIGKKNPVSCLFIYLESTYSDEGRGGGREMQNR